MNSKTKIKNKIHQNLRERLSANKAEIETTMKDLQNRANEFVGAAESRYDTFKEELQDQKNEYAKRVNDVVIVLSELYTLSTNHQTTVDLGAVVTLKNLNSGDKMNLFCFRNIGGKPIVIEGQQYLPLNLTSPLGLILKGKQMKDNVEFNRIQYVIDEIF